MTTEPVRPSKVEYVESYSKKVGKDRYRYRLEKRVDGVFELLIFFNDILETGKCYTTPNEKVIREILDREMG